MCAHTYLYTYVRVGSADSSHVVAIAKGISYKHSKAG